MLTCGGLSTLGTGCSTAVAQTQARPFTPPTPASVTRENPGGDAEDPERAALERLLHEPWGGRRDRWNTVKVPLIDWKNWRRVRIFGHPTRATFRYGDDNYALVTIWYTATDGPSDPATCLKRFHDEARPIAESYSVSLGPITRRSAVQTIAGRAKPVVFDLVEGSIDTLFSSDDYVGGVAAYESWPGTCLVAGFAVVATHHRALAVKVVERWVDDGALRLTWTARVKEAPTPDAR